MEKVFIPKIGINLDICTKGCGGIYFDNRELKHFDKPDKNIDEILKAIKGKKFLEVDDKLPRICPVCRHDMVKNYSSMEKDILIDESGFADVIGSEDFCKIWGGQKRILNKNIDITPLKNEQYKQIIEIKKNKIEEVDDKINSLKKSYKLFENKFLTKYNELIRSINIELDHENNIDLNLCTKTYLLRNEIKMLEKKIMKLTNEKNMYSKWMDLQILIKEIK